MVGKCANPDCPASFRKLGSGKLFAFERGTTARPAHSARGATGNKTRHPPLFFWLCESCSLTFTLGVDATGELILQSIRDRARIAIVDGCRLDHPGAM